MWILDDATFHKLESLKKRSKDLGIDLLPGGTTSILQPLDVVVNKPYKKRLAQGTISLENSGRE